MNLVLFLYIAAFFSIALGEFGQFPFGRTDFSVSATDILLTMCLTALLIWNIGIRKNLVIPKNFIYLILFWAIALISLLFSLDLSGWFYLVRFIIYSSTFYLTFHLVKARLLGLQEFLTLIKIGVMTLAIFGVFQLIIFPDLEVLTMYGYDPHKFRIFSTFLDPNFFGAFLVFGFILSLHELVSKKYLNFHDYLKENHWNLIWNGMLVASIIFTFSRSAYLMLALAMLILLSVKNRKLLLFSVILFIVLYFTFPIFNQRINGAIRIDASASGRFSSWDKGLEIFQKNPVLGVGFNNVRNYSRENNLVQLFSSDGGNSGSGIDSSFIFIMTTTGLIGLVSFSMLMFKILLDFFTDITKSFKYFYSLQFQPVKFLNKDFKLPVFTRWLNNGYQKNSYGRNNYLSLPLLSLTLGVMLNSFFINSLFYPQVMFVWYSLLGVYYGLGEGEGS